MRVISLAFIFTVGIIVLIGQGAPKETRLSAPTYYIAARAHFDGDPQNIRLVGASNLPPRSRLDVLLYDYVGQGSTMLSEHTTAIVSKDGFFEVLARAAGGRAFRHNMVCDVVFSPNYPQQDSSVVQVVGRKGERLGFPKNPQVSVSSGENYYLVDSIHVP